MNREVAIEQRKKRMPKMFRPIYDKAIKGKSRKAAIKASCLECCGFQRKEVNACTDYGCPLYPYRPQFSIDPPVRGGFEVKTCEKSGVSVVGEHR